MEDFSGTSSLQGSTTVPVLPHPPMTALYYSHVAWCSREVLEKQNPLCSEELQKNT